MTSLYWLWYDICEFLLKFLTVRRFFVRGNSLWNAGFKEYAFVLLPAEKKVVHTLIQLLHNKFQILAPVFHASDIILHVLPLVVQQSVGIQNIRSDVFQASLCPFFLLLKINLHILEETIDHDKVTLFNKALAKPFKHRLFSLQVFYEGRQGILMVIYNPQEPILEVLDLSPVGS